MSQKRKSEKNIRRQHERNWIEPSRVRPVIRKARLIENPCLTHQLGEYCANTILLISYAFVFVRCCVFRLQHLPDKTFWHFAMRIVTKLIGSAQSIFTLELMQFAMMLATERTTSKHPTRPLNQHTKAPKKRGVFPTHYGMSCN